YRGQPDDNRGIPLAVIQKFRHQIIRASLMSDIIPAENSDRTFCDIHWIDNQRCIWFCLFFGGSWCGSPFFAMVLGLDVGDTRFLWLFHATTFGELRDQFPIYGIDVDVDEPPDILKMQVVNMAYNARSGTAIPLNPFDVNWHEH